MKRKTLLWDSQIHGLKRLIEPRHRLYWTLALALLLCCALSNLLSTIMRFFDAPTRLTAHDKIQGEIKFPSVLVCPEVFYQDYKIEEFLGNASYPPGMTAQTIRPIIKQLATFYSPDAPYIANELSTLIEFLDFNRLDVVEAGRRLTATCEETLLRCRYMNEDYDCLAMFNMEITLYGFCCTFNGISLKRDILPEDDEKNQKLRVRQSSEVGPYCALMLVVNQSQYIDNVDLTYKWLAVQKYEQYVEESNNGTPLAPGAEVWASFHLEYLEVSEDSRFLGDSLRGCRIDGYKNYFNFYNESSCLLECKLRNLIKRCRCTLPVNYRPLGMPLCAVRNLPCVNRHFSHFNNALCDCPPACYYQSEYLRTESYQMVPTTEPIDSFYHGLDLTKVTVVRVYIKSQQTTSFYRIPIYNAYDLFSQLGGVFNVFFGCSILSILELLQLAWHSIRPDRQRKMKDRKRKMNWFFFGVCCRRRGRVGKRIAKKKIAVLKKNNWLLYR